MIFQTSDGVRLNVVERDGDSELTLVLLHGWVMDHRSWDAVVAGLPGVRVVRMDFRGHGGSDPAPAGTATIDRLADDIAELIDTRIAGRVVLGAHSLGAMALMALADRHPALVADRVAGVAFVATTSGGLSKLTFGLPRWLAALILFVESLANPIIARLPVRRLLGRLSPVAIPLVRFLAFGRKPARGHVARVSAQVGSCHPAALVAFRGELKRHERLHALCVYRDIPAIVLAGDRDRLCTVPQSEAIAAELPNAVLEVFPGAGHMLTYERTADVVAHLSGLMVGLDLKATG
ncbi:putative hydrolase [Alloactinosynnema sp. L-07]|uniref:alpha/beta fold hydrolase n=1 Tax=Alloactinosynnema sp. L-07 TaxID=1653480 RepID=UPI00065F02FB|nr:alpha/beta hydrolase [Alloactinosynnema sp. L-07]CRK61763.1 putative hydrolase [Alloactinosynnema sp. L-07]